MELKEFVQEVIPEGRGAGVAEGHRGGEVESESCLALWWPGPSPRGASGMLGVP